MRTRIKECKQCGHKWLARLITRKIHLCPKCKSTRWYIDDNHPPEGDAVTGRHSILGSPEGHQDSETGEGAMGPSGCLQAATPAQSPHNDKGLTMEQPLKSDAGNLFTAQELYDANKDWLAEVDRIHNHARDAMERAVNPPWLRPSDPATIVENLNEIDQIIDVNGIETELGMGKEKLRPEPDPDPAIMPAPERPSGTIDVTLVRRVEVPKEARGWDDEEDD